MASRTTPTAEAGKLADQLSELGVIRGVLVRMAKQGQILELRCEMPQCYHHKGRKHFDKARSGSRKKDWQISPDHYPQLKKDGGKLEPENVRLSHVRCNQRDYSWRMKIRGMLADGKSLDQIAGTLNKTDASGKKRVPTIHGTNKWTAASVRKAYVS